MKQKLAAARALAFLSCSLLVFVTACSTLENKVDKKAAAPLKVAEVSFDDLVGWENDDQAKTLVALKRSCNRIMKGDPSRSMGADSLAGTYADWHSVCLDVANLSETDTQQARQFFETRFTPYQVHAGREKEGLFTGYYEPLLHGSREKNPPYVIPLYSRPNDLVAVNLGRFKPDLKGEMIYGRVVDGDLHPYYDRKTIEEQGLEETPEIVWVDNAVDAFFLHIQGSGRVQLQDGTLLKIGYAAQNGHPYTAIGRELIDRGVLTKETVSMQSIRQWLENNPEDAADVMNLNASYIFFRDLTDSDMAQAGPLGAEGVPLTAGRSLAVDHRKIPYGVPVFINTEPPVPEQDDRLARLMVAQDTGGAIRGAVRGDVFWGMGDEAAYLAGQMKSRGYAWILLPREYKVPEYKEYTPWWLSPLDFVLGRDERTAQK